MLLKNISLATLLLLAGAAVNADYQVRTPTGAPPAAEAGETTPEGPVVPEFTPEESESAWTAFFGDKCTNSVLWTNISCSGQSVANSPAPTGYAGDGLMPNEPYPSSNPTYLYFAGNPSLTHINAFSSVTSAVYIDFYNNPALTNISGLSNLTSGVNIHIYNTGISNVDALSNITGGNLLKFHNNPNLTNLDGLINVTGAYILHLYGNPSLNDISGLQNYAATRKSGKWWGQITLENRVYGVRAPMGSPFCNGISAGVVKIKVGSTLQSPAVALANYCQ